jgi:hypothetical protein
MNKLTKKLILITLGWWLGLLAGFSVDWVYHNRSYASMALAFWIVSAVLLGVTAIGVITESLED